MDIQDHDLMDDKGVAAEALADLMTQCFIGGVIAASSVVIHTTLAIGPQGESASAFELSYLYQATEGQQAEVALGQMAVQKASSDEVKQFGARMMQDHLRASEELGKLTTQEGLRETGELSMPHQLIQRMLLNSQGRSSTKPIWH